MDSVKQQCNYTWKLYLFRFYQRRTFVLLLLIFLAFDQYYITLGQACEKLDYPCSPWFFINIMTNDFTCAAVGLAAVYLFSSAPYLNRNGMYQLIRIGEVRWAAAQLGSIALCSFSMTAALFLMGILRMLPNIDWTFGWGKMMKTLAMTNAADQFGITFNLQYSFMESMEAWQAGILVLILDSLVFMLLGFVIFSVGLLIGRTAGLIISGIFAILPFATQAWDISKHYWFHMISPVSWLQTGLFHTKRLIFSVIPPVSTVFCILAGYLAVTLVITAAALHRKRFQWNGEEE
ncbi:MAG: hypothetical protein Q4D16_10330 [Eubacteriales bacterium]|nr:hypothetical protein [Eubacteriales bacterium]